MRDAKDNPLIRLFPAACHLSDFELRESLIVMKKSPRPGLLSFFLLGLVSLLFSLNAHANYFSVLIDH